MKVVRFSLSNDDLFSIIKNKSKKPEWIKRQRNLDDVIKEINFDNYFIYKKTGKQKEVTKEDFLKFNYSGYIFFNKTIYDKKELQQSLEYLWSLGITIIYLNKPLPRLSDLKKIKVIDGYNI